MERSIKDRNILDSFCEQFCKITEKYTQYIVVSGFVAIASGRTRGTEDIDMIIERIDYVLFEQYFAHLVKDGFVCMQTSESKEAYSYLVEKLSIRFTYKDNPLPEMEVKFVKDPLDVYQMRTRTKLNLTGLDIWFSNINVNIAFKEELLKSTKDIEDAQHLRVVYTELVDEGEINDIKTMIRRYRL